MQITQKMLLDAGGWQAMKTAKTLCDAGRVSEVSYEPPLLRGLVKEGGTRFAASLKITGTSRIENLCTCRESRQWGKICAHSLAAGLAWLARENPPAKPPTVVAASRPAIAGKGKFIVSPEVTDFKLHLILPPALEAVESVESIMVVAEIDRGGKRSSLATLSASNGLRCTAEDALVLELLQAFTTGDLPGMVLFSPLEFAQFSAALSNHPRVTFGRDKPAHLGALGQKFAPAAGPLAAQPATTTLGHESFSLEIEGSLNYLAAKLGVVRQGALVLLHPESPSTISASQKAAIQRLEASGFSYAKMPKEWVLRGEMAIVRFFASELPKLKREWKVVIGGRFTSVTAEIERIEPRITIRDAGERWFDLEMTLTPEGGAALSPGEIQRLLRSGQSSYRQSNGKLAVFDAELIEDFQHALKQSAPTQTRAGQYRIDRMHAPHLQGILETQAAILATPAWDRWVTSARQHGRDDSLSLGAFEDILRPYQKEGVRWLYFLSQHGLGGILADEMGLGKTVQTLAFLSIVPKSDAPSLVVCPSSLVFNWRQEAQRFTPDLRTMEYTSGTARNIDNLDDVDLLLTSYGMLRSNPAFFDQFSFNAVILDEAQHIKNTTTQNAILANGLKSRCRFALTGTPLENSLVDLFSLMNFVLPGFLGEKKVFAEEYAQSIDGQNNRNSLQKLSAKIAPYMLRRKKQNILPELPEKTIQILKAPMGATQSLMHQQLMQHAQSELKSLAGDSRNKLKIFALLTKLRQTACDFRLLAPEQDIPEHEASGKLRLFEELLAEILDGQRRVLVFSQFVGMLKLLAQSLTKSGTRFSYLDGSTSKREEVVGEFKRDAAIPVFLISLKAGGVGLNLTEADTVIHFDPWWNPAVEAQASDRIHRIGQTRAVTIYKLISSGSVEEKMLKLQQQKSALVEGILEEANATSHLGMEELRTLIED